MRKLTHLAKKYKFVNEKTIDGVTYRLYRRTKRVVNTVTETVLVRGRGKNKEVSVIKNVGQVWRKISKKKRNKRTKNVNRI